MDKIKIRFLDSHAEFPCMSLSQAKFNTLGDYLWFSSTKQANWGHRFLFYNKKKKKIEKFWFKCLVCIRRVHLGRRILSLKIKSNLEQSK